VPFLLFVVRERRISRPEAGVKENDVADALFPSAAII
jgi:hypothetical protein